MMPEQEKTLRQTNLMRLYQSDAWRYVCEDLDRQILNLEISTNNVDVNTPGYEKYDVCSMTPRVFDIKQKKILQMLKDMPKTLCDSLNSNIKEEDKFLGLEE